MTLTQLRYLVAIADSGFNITLAAERVHATQPGLSKQLKQLEDELGFQLFRRKGRSLLGVAPAGVKVIEHARRILAEAANIRSYAANERGEYRGRLRLATTHTQARYVLPKVIADVTRRYPEVSVDLFVAGDAEVLAKLDESDFALVSSAGRVPETNGLAIPLFRWQRVLLVPKTHPLARLDGPLKVADLARYPLISYESSNQPESSLQRTFAAAGVTPQIAMTARDANLIEAYVRTGLGAGLLAEMAVGGRKDDDLRVLPAPVELPECITWAIVPRGRVLREYALTLLHALAPQIDGRDLRNILEGNLPPLWPDPPRWQADGATNPD
ncbi:LysR substrate-binding domain-containing protein [Thermomonas sp.]|uniref:LysR substrate-binding domain-containing protein n=1 Tax=Thermomonas sp. TaxID=1971895 RepID=UPI001D3516E2|nr:LysR substrate-binding domain-containing protein [Thermomonas sp.]MBZ0087452.1 LysR family transcriptional regulator [Thermomonas sp.]HRO63671.1 LysR substrate-binding domain-containing protein [Thermomonas sp.]